MDKEYMKVVVVDDDVTNLSVVYNALIGDFDVFTVPSGEKLFPLLEKIVPDLILLDVVMPGMDGYEVLRNLKMKDSTADIPVIFLTTVDDPQHEIKGLELGAIDYISKPFLDDLLKKRIETHLTVESQKKVFQKQSVYYKERIDENSKHIYDLKVSILKIIAELVEYRDSVTGKHIERTRKYMEKFLEFMFVSGTYAGEISPRDMDILLLSSQLHDIGKISIRDSVLLKPGKLTHAEYEEIKQHTVIGADIIDSIEKTTHDAKFLEHAKVIARSHHERWDGNGYPDGLKGEQIPLLGRLMSIVDVYDVLTNQQSYKEAYSHEKSVNILAEGAGKRFDPILTDLFVENADEFAKILEQCSADSDGADDAYDEAA